MLKKLVQTQKFIQVIAIFLSTILFVNGCALVETWFEKKIDFPFTRLDIKIANVPSGITDLNSAKLLTIAENKPLKKDGTSIRIPKTSEPNASIVAAEFGGEIKLLDYFVTGVRETPELSYESTARSIVFMHPLFAGLPMDWADPAHEDSGIEETIVSKIERYPLEYISIHLVEELSKFLENDDIVMPPFSRIFPVGWYKTEITYAEDDESQDTMETVTEFVMVYEHTQKRFQNFIQFINEANLKEEWSKECLEYAWIESEIEPWTKKYFDADSDNIGKKLSSSVAKIVRHIAQNESLPHYYPFEDKALYDVDKIAQKVIDLKLFHHARKKFLQEEFTKPNSLWQTFYKSFKNFETAVHASEMKIISDPPSPIIVQPIIDPPVTIIKELTEKEKKQVKERDGNACLCCGDHRRLQIDHVFPFSLGGETSIDNSQTLCMRCNGFKGKNEIDFRTKKTPLKTPKAFDTSNLNKLVSTDKNITESLTRVINFFYNCSAVYRIVHCKANSDKYLPVWEIHLFSGNDTQWLREHESQICNFIYHQLGCPLVIGIKVITHN